MPARLRDKLTYANTMATLAVFIALGGGAYAAVKLPANSVGAKQIRKNAVRSSAVKDRSLLARDFKRGQLPAGARGADGPVGPQGPTGAPGAAGSARAYGTVSDTGALDAARSKGLSVTKITGQAGAYCVRPASGSGIDPTTVTPVVSADLATGVGTQHTAQVSSHSFYPAQCPASAGWEIYTQNEVSGAMTTADTGFSILVP